MHQHQYTNHHHHRIGPPARPTECNVSRPEDVLPVLDHPGKRCNRSNSQSAFGTRHLSLAQIAPTLPSIFEKPRPPLEHLEMRLQLLGLLQDSQESCPFCLLVTRTLLLKCCCNAAAAAIVAAASLHRLIH